MEDTVLSLPYLHRTEYRPPGSRVTSGTLVVAFAPFAVPSVTSGEAPVAAVKWVSPGRDERTSGPVPWPAPGDAEVVPYRSYRGRSYYPLRHGDVPLGAERLVSDLAGETACVDWHVDDLTTTGSERYGADGVPSLGRFGTEAQVFSRELVKAGGRGKVRKVADDSDVSRGRAQAAWGDGLLLVDGEAWTSPAGTVEPHYVVSLEDGGVHLWISTVPNPRCAAWTAFRADARGDAVAFAEGWALREGGTFVDHGDSINVVDAGALVTDVVPMLAASIADGNARTEIPAASWPDGMATALSEVERLTAVGGTRACGPEWAASVLRAHGDFRRLASESGLLDDPDVASIVRRREPAFASWEEFHRSRRPDVVAMMGVTCEEDEASLVAFAP